MKSRLYSLWLAVVAVIAACALGILGLPAAAFAQSPALSLDPTSGPSGTQVTVTGEGWAGPDWASGVRIDLSKVLNPGSEEPLADGIANPRPDGSGGFKDVKVTIPSTVTSGTVLNFSVLAAEGGHSAANAWFTVTGGQSSQPAQPDQPSQVKPDNGKTPQESFEQQAIEQLKTNTECMLSLQQAKGFSRFDPNIFQELADTVNNCMGAFQGSAQLLTPGQVE